MQIADREELLARCRELASTPGLRLAHLRAMAAEVVLSAELLAELHQPDPARPYGRHVLYADDKLEVMVATWTPGVPCLPHDHGGSYGAVRVLRGQAAHTVWRVSGGALEVAMSETTDPGQVMACGPDLVHSMGDNAASESLMTLHLYTAAIDHMVVYDVEAGDTCVVEGNCGAWIPEPDSGMLRSRNQGIHRRIELRAA